MSISERQKELRRRRKRRKTYARMKSKLTDKVDAHTKEKFAEKLRKMTPAADTLISDWGLDR